MTGRTGNQALVGVDGDQLEGSQGEGGSSSRSGGAGNEGVDRLRVRGRRQHNRQDRERHGRGGVPGSKRLQWSGVGQSGAEWSGVERGGGLTPLTP